MSIAGELVLLGGRERRSLAGLSTDDIDFTTTAVPATARMPRLALMMSFWAICSAMFWMVVSATLAMTFGAVNTIIALLLAVVTFSLINGVIVRFAIERGLSVALFSKLLFGSVGADLAALLLFATATWYAVFEGSVIAQAFHAYFDLSITSSYYLVVAYSVLLTLGSVQTWLDKINGALLPIYIVGVIAAITLAISHYGFSAAWLTLAPPAGVPAHGWLNCFAVYLGVWSMMMFTLDYARFGRREDRAFHVNVTFGWGFYTFSLLGNGLVGIFLVGTVPSSGPLSEIAIVVVLLKLMGWAGMLFVWVSQTRINTANFYVAALNLMALLRRRGMRRVSRPFCVFVVGALVLVIMQVDIFSFLLKALAYQGVLIEAWVAIALVYMISDRDRGAIGAPLLDEALPAFNIAGFSAWLGATIIGIAMLNAGPTVSLLSAPATAISAAAFFKLGSGRSMIFAPR